MRGEFTSLEKRTMLEAILGFVAGIGAGYVVFKLRFGQVRKLVDAIDDAVADDKISGEEAEKIFDALQPLVNVLKIWIAKYRK